MDSVRVAHDRCPVPQEVFEVSGYYDLVAVSRSKSVINPAEAFTGVHREADEELDIALREFAAGTLPWSLGSHAARRKIWNSLVRSAELVRIQEEIVLPAAQRHMERLLTPNDAGEATCDLAQLMAATFTEVAAQLIGLLEPDSEALQDYGGPMQAVLVAQFFEDRAGLITSALALKEKYVAEFFNPARAACLQLIKQVEAGQRTGAELPETLMRFMLTGAHPDYEDEDLAVRESIFFMAASVGTSSQSLIFAVRDLVDWFAEHPEDMAKRTDPDFLKNAYQETLRLWGPGVTYATRVASEDFTVSGRAAKKDQEIHLQIRRASQDQTVFGDDAAAFNPWREVPPGVNRYALAFGSGPHLCPGLRMVVGSGGSGGAHTRLLRILFEAGIEADPDKTPQVMAMKTGKEEADWSDSYISYPVVFRNWKVG